MPKTTRKYDKPELQYYLNIFTGDDPPEVIDGYLCVPQRKILHKGDRRAPAAIARHNRWRFEIDSSTSEVGQCCAEFLKVLLENKDALRFLSRQYDVHILCYMRSTELLIRRMFPADEIQELSQLGMRWVFDQIFESYYTDECGHFQKYEADYYNPDFPDFEGVLKMTLTCTKEEIHLATEVSHADFDWYTHVNEFVRGIGAVDISAKDRPKLLVQAWTNCEQAEFVLEPELLQLLSRYGFALDVEVHLSQFHAGVR